MQDSGDRRRRFYLAAVAAGTRAGAVVGAADTPVAAVTAVGAAGPSAGIGAAAAGGTAAAEAAAQWVGVAAVAAEPSAQVKPPRSQLFDGNEHRIARGEAARRLASELSTASHSWTTGGHTESPKLRASIGCVQNRSLSAHERSTPRRVACNFAQIVPLDSARLFLNRLTGICRHVRGIRGRGGARVLTLRFPEILYTRSEDILSGSILHVHGEVDFLSAPSLQTEIMHLIDRGRTVIVDFSELQYLDMKGVHVLEDCHQRAEQLGQRCVGRVDPARPQDSHHRQTKRAHACRGYHWRGP
jgi:ABC-type transporter Mla MlaB component